MLANNMIRAIVFVNDESTIVKAIHSRYCLHKVGLCGKYQEIFPVLLQSTHAPDFQNVTKHLIENVARFFSNVQPWCVIGILMKITSIIRVCVLIM